MKWFRFYSEVIHDPKLLRLSEKTCWRWVQFLSIANQQENRGSLPPIEDIALVLRLSQREVTRALEDLQGAGLIDISTDGIRPHNWDKWQPTSDVSYTENPSASGKLGNHRRWHVERNVIASDCEFCIAPNRPDDRPDDRPDVAKSHRPESQKKIREEEIREEEIREDTDEDAPAHPFCLTYVQHYQRRTAGRRPPSTEHAAALALEREYGSSACIELGNDLEWLKHPNYMAKILEERRNGNGNGKGRSQSAAGTDTGGMAAGLSDMDKRRAFVAAGG